VQKEPLLAFINGKITELNGLKEFIADENEVNVINARIEALESVKSFIDKAPIPFELI
jgi:hypothetical protein